MLRAGSQVKTLGFLLGKVLYKESDYIVDIFTADLGRIKGIAKSAARSKKRFAGGLESISLIEFVLQAPRDADKFNEPLWRIQSTQINNPYLNINKNFDSLNTAFFITRMLKDLTPVGTSSSTSDSEIALLFIGMNQVFTSLCDEQLELKQNWIKFIFWSFFSKSFGFGSLSGALKNRLLSLPEEDFDLWKQCLDPNNLQLIRLISSIDNENYSILEYSDLVRIYSLWLKNSNIHWNYFVKEFLKLN